MFRPSGHNVTLGGTLANRAELYIAFVVSLRNEQDKIHLEEIASPKL